ncbi:hypothetical protein BBFL7_02346 [Flavobacteria bacterium BBFL7]|nr:hypothetical protein BBFL7_02346 [Flavobacteria bacterium BBFL7]
MIYYKIDALSNEVGTMFNSFFDNYIDDYYHVYIKPLGADLTQFQSYIYFTHQRHYYDFVRCNLKITDLQNQNCQLSLIFIKGDAYQDYWRAGILIGIAASMFMSLLWMNMIKLSAMWLLIIVPLIFVVAILFMKIYARLSVKSQQKRIVETIERHLKKNFIVIKI